MISVPLGNKRITQEKLHKERGVWRAEEKVCEKPCLPLSIQEDCTKRWITVGAKALYNSDVFPPCMIIQIVGFLGEAFP